MHEAFARHRVAAIGRELPSGLDPRPARDMNDDGQAINGQRFVLGNDSIEIVIHQGAFASHPATIQFHHPPIVRAPVEIARHALGMEGPAGKIVAANRRRVPATVFFQDGTKTASWIVLTPFRPCGCAGCSSATYSEKVRFSGVHSGLPSNAGASSFYSSGTREF